jgi:hypothetical protein
MTTPQLIASKIWRGYGKAAQRLGPPVTVYRPTNALAPLMSSEIVATLPASFAVDTKYVHYNKYGNASWYCLIDGNYTQPGDYLVGDDTWFIAQQHIDLPILAIQCTRTITLSRAAQQTGTGINGYGGNTVAGETTLLAGWPASVLKAPYGTRPEVNLPGDTIEPKWFLLLPSLVSTLGVTVVVRDIITDDLSRRYVVEAAEITELGWRIVCRQVMT